MVSNLLALPSSDSLQPNSDGLNLIAKEYVFLLYPWSF